MKKFFALVLIILISPFIGGAYGMLHDELTYSLCPEYFTKFKFIQFHIEDFVGAHEREGVLIVGFGATWWVGLFIGIILGPLSLIHKDAKAMITTTMRALFINLIVAFVIGLTGYFYGKYFLANEELNWWFPENLNDRDAFISVGSMHNFSYAGGVIGLAVAILYVVWKKYKPAVKS